MQEPEKQKSDLASEWSLLQNQFDSYEKFSLLIKLVNIALLTVATVLNNNSIVILILLMVLWLQDAIWKTFQSRIEDRLLQIEKVLSTEKSEEGAIRAYQFNRQFLENRPSTIGLIFEYCKQAVRPTIAFPHVVLVLIAIYQHAI